MAAGQYRDEAIAAANRYGVPVDMFLWQIGQESSWDPNARNPLPGSTSGGLAGFIKPTADAFGIDRFNPTQALDAAAKYDAQLYKQEGTWQGALTKYGTLHDASPKVMAAFEASMGNTQPPSIMATLKQFYDDSMAPLNGAAYTPEEKAGAYDYKAGIAKYMTSGALIVLGIVVIGVAILSNKTVQQTVVTAVKKGK